MAKKKMESTKEGLQEILTHGFSRMIISKPRRKTNEFKKLVVERKTSDYQLARYTEKQVFHENLSANDLVLRLVDQIQGQFGQVNAWNTDMEMILLISKDGSCHYKSTCLKKVDANETNTNNVANSFSHNRKKQYLLEEGHTIEPLVDMGIYTKEGKIVRTMYDKYRQINRFLEILDDELENLSGDTLHLIDFGCGKSYLTFVVYYYLTQVRNRKVEMVGLDLKADVIAKCNEAAKRYGYEGLRFELGDINGYEAPFDVDVVITLHACDTATDYALYNAIQWKARLIFSVPCCQHELNQQMKPDTMTILSRYGIIQERFSALATDAIRANLLECAGYRTQLLEFVDLSHTPKNILIRAVRRGQTPKTVEEKASREIEKIIQEFHFEPTLYRLLKGE